VPTTPDLAVVNCEPTVRVAFDIIASFRPRGTVLIIYQRFVDKSIIPEKGQIVNTMLITF
jgi:hypothetical protein